MCQAPGIQQCKNPALLEFTFLGRGNTYDMMYDMTYDIRYWRKYAKVECRSDRFAFFP